MSNIAPSTARLGILCMLCGMFLVSLNDMLIKSLAGGYALHQIVFIRSVIGIVLTALMMRAEGGWRLIYTGRPVLHLVRALLIVFANSAMYAAIVAMPLAKATAIYFVAPLFVTLLSIPILGEKVGPRRFAAIGAGFGGVLLMMWPQLSGAGGGDTLGWLVVLPVLGAAGYATMSVLTRKLGAVTRASALAMHLQVAFLIVSVAMWWGAGDGRFVTAEQNDSMRFLLRAWVWPPVSDLLPICALGVTSALVGYVMTQAYRLSPASIVAPFEYVLLIYALFWGWTVFGEWPEPAVFVGAAVIIAAGCYVFLRADRKKHAKHA